MNNTHSSPGVDRRPKLRPKAEAFFPSASASVAEAFRQKVWQKVLNLKEKNILKKKLKKNLEK